MSETKRDPQIVRKIFHVGLHEKNIKEGFFEDLREKIFLQCKKK
jgi:hypothetical protein